MVFPVMLALAIAQAGYSAFQGDKAQRGLDATGERQKHVVDPALQQAADAARLRSGQGFTGAEKAAFRQNVAQDINTQSRKALDIGGGNLGRTISRFGTIANIGAENKFAAQDAQVHRDNIAYSDNLTKTIQGIHDRETDSYNRDYNAKQEAYGGAVSQNKSNFFASLAMAGQYGLGALGKHPAAPPNTNFTGMGSNLFSTPADAPPNVDPFTQRQPPVTDWTNPYGAPREPDWHQNYVVDQPDFSTIGARYGMPRETYR